MLKKIWIIYHSKTGNNKAICQQVGNDLKEKFDIKISSVKEIKPNEITSNPPDILIVGSRIVIGRPDKTIKGFVKKIGKTLKQPITKAATIYTHVLDWDEAFAKMPKLLKENGVALEILDQPLEIKLEKQNGPIESGQESKIEEFVQKIYTFA